MHKMSKLVDELLLEEMIEEDDHDLMFSNEANRTGEEIDSLMESKKSINENMAELFPQTGRFNEQVKDYELQNIAAYHESIKIEGDD